MQKRILKAPTVIAAVVLTFVATTILGGYSAENVEEQDSKLIDIKANLVYPHKIGNGESVLCMVGEFAAQHNGAVITADSAVRFDDDRLECFGNVLINKNTTYAYADKATYDGESSVASLYAPLVKVVDQDITMYAYNFDFNTLDNVGIYWGGGVTIKSAEEGSAEEDDIMESQRGYYYADTKQVIGVEEVEVIGEGYKIKGDSVIYYMEREVAYFFENTNIWNSDDDYIYGDEGLFRKAEDLFSVTRNGYMLTREQEVWSDSMEYYRNREEAILKHNIQIDDSTNKVLAFGDYARYWGAIEQVLLTRRPTVISYDLSQGDSLFMRGDTILLKSYPLNEGPIAEREEAKRQSNDELMAELMGRETPEEEMEEEHDHEHDHDHEHEVGVEDLDSEEIAVKTTDEIAVKSTEKELKKAQKIALRDSLRAEKLNQYNIREFRRLEERRAAVREKIEERRAKGRNIFADSMTLQRLESEIGNSQYFKDSLAKVGDVDSLSDGFNLDDIAHLGSTNEAGCGERDSLYRIINVYRNAEVYRNDFQLSTDSLVMISYDTTMQAHIRPVVWSASHQISSEQMYLYTRNGDLDYAEFFGKPVMSSQVIPEDTTYFNQVSGKEMVAFFKDNNVYRNDVNANVETIYFLQDEDSGEVNTISKVVSGSASFFIENQQLDGVIYRSDPEYVFAPLEKMPEDLSFTLDNFKWYGAYRPTREQIFKGEIRASRREEMSQKERPTLPIMEKIDATRRRLTRSGEWQDRNDMVSHEATVWMQSLGFTPGEPRPDGDSPF